MNDLRVGVVGIPGKWSTETLADAIERETSFRHVIDMSSVRADLTQGSLWHGKTDLATFDAIIVKKINDQYSPHVLDQIELLRLAESSGARVFSRPASIIRMIDRLGCSVALASAGIPMPRTTVTESIDEALAACDEYGKAVLKPLFSTKARGMIVIDDHLVQRDRQAALRDFAAANRMIYIQEMVDLPGHDLGMVFLGGEYLGTYARVGRSGTWNTTIRDGGRYAEYHPDAETIAIAKRAQAVFEMDFTTVDVVETDEGPLVFEVSAFGGFRGAKEGIGIDAAKLYANYVMEKLKHE